MADEDEEPEDDGEPTLYDILYCAHTATDAELKQAYKQQALHWHPDKNDDPEAEERFKLVNQAWGVLSDEHQRAAYDRSLATGDNEARDNFHEGRAQNTAAASARAAQQAQRDFYEAFMRSEEEERRRQLHRERGLLVGVCSFAIWVVALLLLLWQFAGASAHLFPPALELTNRELGRYQLGLDFKGFNEKLGARHASRLPQDSSLMLPDAWGGRWLRTHTPYLRIALNRTSEVRRAPEAGVPNGRGWLLVSANKGEDIYGRPIDLVSNTLLRVPKDSTLFPATVICARLLKSGNVKQKEWWSDLSRALGGRLRPFELALAPTPECEPEYGVVALLVSTVGGLLAAKLTVRLVLGPLPTGPS